MPETFPSMASVATPFLQPGHKSQVKKGDIWGLVQPQPCARLLSWAGMKAGELRVRKGRLRAALLKKRFSSASAWKSRLRGRLPCTSKTTQARRALASLPRAPPPAPAAGAGVPGRYPAPCCHHHLLLGSGFQGSRPTGPWPLTSGPGDKWEKPQQATPGHREVSGGGGGQRQNLSVFPELASVWPLCLGHCNNSGWGSDSCSWDRHIDMPFHLKNRDHCFYKPLWLPLPSYRLHRHWPGAKKPEFSAEVGLKLTLCIFLAEREVACKPPSPRALGKAPADQPLWALGPLQGSLDTHPPSTFPAPSWWRRSCIFP